VETLLTALSWDVVALLNLVPVFKAFRTRELWVGGVSFLKNQNPKNYKTGLFFTIRRKDILNH